MGHMKIPRWNFIDYNTGGYGGAVESTGNFSGTKYTQATIRTYGGGNTSDGSLVHCWCYRKTSCNFWW